VKASWAIKIFKIGSMTQTGRMITEDLANPRPYGAGFDHVAPALSAGSKVYPYKFYSDGRAKVKYSISIPILILHILSCGLFRA
jgi:hypothetical protein